MYATPLNPAIPTANVPATTPHTLAGRIIAALLAAGDRRRQRQALAELDERLLNDIGLTRAQARSESERRS